MRTLTSTTPWVRGLALAAALAAAGCGGGGTNPIGNPPTVQNPLSETAGRKLSFIYYQRCINRIFVTPLQTTINGHTSTNTCAGSGCHDTVAGTGGAFRIEPGAQPVDLALPANTAEVVRLTPMYRNFYSAQGEVLIGQASDSRLIAKPLLLNVLHGGGLIFSSLQDPDVRLIAYWLSHPMPEGQDEFSSAAAAMFTPQDPATGACNSL